MNGLHPFVGSFFDEFTGKTSGLPLEIFAMAEVLLESHLYQASLKQDEIDQVMAARDQVLRHVARESGRRTALTIANALRHARNDEDQLEIEVVESFRSLGFDATRVGGKGKPDGVATAHLSPDGNSQPRRYAVTLEAKSKKKEGAKLKTKTFGVSAIARQAGRSPMRTCHCGCAGVRPYCRQGKRSRERNQSGSGELAANGKPRTITAIHVDDLARLVQLRPQKHLGLDRIREMFRTCSLPEDCKQWIDKVEKEKVVKPPYRQIINAIHALQQKFARAAVEYGSLRVFLDGQTPPYTVATNDELIDICKSMAGFSPCGQRG